MNDVLVVANAEDIMYNSHDMIRDLVDPEDNGNRGTAIQIKEEDVFEQAISEFIPVQEFDYIITDTKELAKLKQDIENLGDLDINKKEYALRRKQKLQKKKTVVKEQTNMQSPSPEELDDDKGNEYYDEEVVDYGDEDNIEEFEEVYVEDVESCVNEGSDKPFSDDED